MNQRTVALSLCVIAGLAGPTYSAAKPKPGTKPASKPAAPQKAPPANPPIKGANQMAGGEGKLGVTYTVGKESPLNFTLNSAEYTVERVNIEDSTHDAKAEEKLLVLNCTIHNPNKYETGFDWATFRFTVVDAENVNHDYVQQVGDSGSRKSLNIQLKPAQKIDVYTVIKVPAKGVIPKLIVQHHSGGDVLRYDLRGQVKALAAPFADPTDKNGATARTEVTAEAGTFYPMLGFDVKLVKTEYSAGPLGEWEAEEGQRFFIATLTIKNAASSEAHYDFGNFAPTLVASDDEKVEWNSVLLKTARNEAASGDLKPGAEYTARIFFSLPKDVTAKTLTFSEPESRVYIFDVSGTK